MKKIKNCAVCNKKFLRVIDLGLHPCADTFLDSKLKAGQLPKFPLQVGYCKCFHFTAINKISGYVRYQKFKYSYTADNSPVSRNHFITIAKKLSKKVKLNKKSFVVEAGSNDGTFLNAIKRFSKSKVLGVDPSKNVSLIAKKRGVNTLNNFFNLKIAKFITKKYMKADLFYGANVFNHVDDLKEFLEAIKEIINHNGLIVLEVPSLESLIEKVGFDTIYHEHRNYFSQNSLYKLFKYHNLNIIKIEKINYMSGSLRVFAQNKAVKNKKLNKMTISLKKIIQFEKNMKVIKSKINKFIFKMKKENKVVAGIGAATKGNTMLNYCKLTYRDVDFILDKSKLKIGKFTPGSCIKILDENLNNNFQALIILPWNISNYLIKKFVKNTGKPYISVQNIVRKFKK